eukprot:5046352-Prymnesium_polylepis.1
MGTLRVTVVKAEGLLAADSNGFSDPFVKVYVRGKKRTTKVIYKTLNPEWNQVLRWTGQEAFLLQGSLDLKVYDYDYASFNDFLGDASLSLEDLRREIHKERLAIPGSPSSKGTYTSVRIERELELSKQGTISLVFEWVPDESEQSAAGASPPSAPEPASPRSPRGGTVSNLLGGAPMTPRGAEQSVGGTARRPRQIQDHMTMSTSDMADLIRARRRNLSVINRVKEDVVKVATEDLTSVGFRRALTFATVHLTLVEGRDLEAKDAGGTSDPYVKISHKNIKYRSKTIDKTLHPVWNQEFRFEGTLRELVSHPLVFHTYDEDRATLDDWMGMAELDLEKVVDDPAYQRPPAANGLDEPTQGRAPRHIMLRLSTKGSLFVQIRIERLDSLWASVQRLWRRNVVEPLNLDAMEPMQLRRDYTHAQLTVRLLAGKDLLAADRGSSSDPYVNLSLGEESHSSSVLYRTLNPVWDETFEFDCILRTVLREPLELNAFDEDLVSAK